MSSQTPQLQAKTLALHWHEGARPIYTLDTQNGADRLATGGGDNNVRIWRLVRNSEGCSVEYLSSISKHTQAINCVRFSPNGELLATCSDDGTIMIWQKSDHIVKEFGSEDQDEDIKESWVVKTACFANSMSEIYDISWSPDSKYICCGLMDNIIRIFDTNTGALVKQIAEHNHYVQGVTWDPLGEYICSQSVDRSVHVYKITSINGELNIAPTAFYKSIKSERVKSPLVELTKENLDKMTTGTNSTSPSSTPLHTTSTSISNTMEPPVQTPRHKRTYSNSSTNSSHSILNRCTSPLPAVMPSSPSLKHESLNKRLPPAAQITPCSITSQPQQQPQQQQYLYHGESLQSFFRRLTFSPDGSFLLATSGMFKTRNEATGEDYQTNTVHVYTRGGINKPPIVHIPGLKKPAIAIRFSPIKYALLSQDDGIADVFSLNYRMIFAIATQDSILIYDTQRLKCLGIASNLHYAVITDLTWCKDGKDLFISSSDGFVSTIHLGDELLGDKIGDFSNVGTVSRRTSFPGTSLKLTPAVPSKLVDISKPEPETEPTNQSTFVAPKPDSGKRNILEMLSNHAKGKAQQEEAVLLDQQETDSSAKKQHI